MAANRSIYVAVGDAVSAGADPYVNNYEIVDAEGSVIQLGELNVFLDDEEMWLPDTGSAHERTVKLVKLKQDIGIRYGGHTKMYKAGSMVLMDQKDGKIRALIMEKKAGQQGGRRRTRRGRGRSRRGRSRRAQ